MFCLEFFVCARHKFGHVSCAKNCTRRFRVRNFMQKTNQIALALKTHSKFSCRKTNIDTRTYSTEFREKRAVDVGDGDAEEAEVE